MKFRGNGYNDEVKCIVDWEKWFGFENAGAVLEHYEKYDSKGRLSQYTLRTH